ncbi:Cytochrome oxidase biogenesis protein Surf1, facilitates heme A insertion [hydrothermal vent metagenome]|uniref:Cytochrome oxidase biogenesis protein Surf1, facilitates heme A insertion n=1 Tax=hydrothermal vent metagenome TaxID=652676 RepID=A0A3B0RAE4_9ZZZZ
MRKIPIIVTIIVIAAVATMIGLGFWQLQRADWKNSLLATYEAAKDMPAIAYPVVPVEEDAPYFRKSSVNCLEVIGWRSVSGRSERGESGWAHIAQCKTTGGEGPGAQVVVGWSKRPDNPNWSGGIVDGEIAPDSQSILRLVASEPIDGLSKNQSPSVDDIPNNHMAYAVQWFLFAGIALLIYGLALRGRNKSISKA